MSRRTNPIASGVLAFVLGVLSALALAHWLASCWEAGPQAMCLFLATRHARWRWLDKLWSRIRAACIRKELEWQESALDNMEEAHQALPAQIRQQKRRVEALRIDLAVASHAARGDE